MRLFLLTALTMVAFAANSILNRLAVESGASEPGGFAVVRVLAGAVTLAVLVHLRGGRLPLLSVRRIAGAGALSLYMIGFSTAYLTLDAGLGALILFGVVQITMFGVTSATGMPPMPRQMAGAVIAFGGLAYILWPAGEVRADPAGAVLMVLAGIGWAVYTLAGRTEPDALAGTGANFVAALPVTAGAILLLGGGWGMTPVGYGLAILSGAVTSGLGYALWYRVLPHLAPSIAATVQLSVPVIAILGGILFLAEAASWRLVSGTALVLGGIALAVVRRRAN
ncbi:DMT family transporter [Ruegeria sediminis]|uniref:DMT family transporter n=1 Tax=Ruegeria sediminis TaxID=2583820 RepID=A0ABY2X477_9RHOB|nr:DMT family transporter [Ruegeria sediminis]TMV09878.1 DMT family transporter [Ruegeria sediminis]